MNSIIDQIIQIKVSVDDGRKDSIVAQYELNQIEKVLKAAKDEVKELALIEADNYSEKTFEHKGFIIERRAGRKIYDFNNIASYQIKKKELKDIEAKAKAAYDSYSKGGIFIDEETGEQIEPPVVKYTSDVLVIKKSDL